MPYFVQAGDPAPHLKTMTRTLSKPSVLKRLCNAGFDMNAIIEQNRGEIEIGYLTDGRATWEQREINIKLAEQASLLLGWGYYVSGYGSCWLQADMGCQVTRELIRNNMD
jgi:Neuraminidase (sialidase)